MEYLFFDIECANCFNGSGKICEFGYVITDENYNVKDKQIWLVDPQDGFDWYVVKKMLAFHPEMYRASDAYPVVFPKIKALFERKDILIIGHTVDADAGYLNDEARRYELPFFNYSFYDAKEMYTAYANASRGVGLEEIGQMLGSNGPNHAHKSVDDAEATMEVVKKMCASLEVSLPELISLCPDCKGKTENGFVWTPVRERAEASRKQRFVEQVGQNKIRRAMATRFIKYRNHLKINTKSTSSLAGKSICFSRNYEDEHLKEMMYLVKKLAEMGVKCIGKASECDLFVRYDLVREDGEEKPCSRLRAVCLEIDAGREIEIVTLDQLLNLIGVKQEDLENVSIPSEEDFEAAHKKKESRGSTVREILEASGVDVNLIVHKEASGL